MGAKKCVYKILNIYFSLLEISKHNRSKTENFFLVLSVHDRDLKDHRKTVYEQLLKDLEELEINGIHVNGKTIKFGLIVHMGDNLEAHNVGGFIGSFSSNNFCRICHLQKADLQTIDGVPRSKRWTKEEYDNICKAMESENGVPVDMLTYGVRYRCVFNKLSSFHCIGQFPLDIMHDWLELVGGSDAQACIVAMSKAKFFNIEDYNNMIEEIKLEDYEIGDKPIGVTVGAEKLAGKAMAVALHIRLMPLIISRLVNQKDLGEHMDLFKLMRIIHKLNEYVLGDKFTEDDATNMQMLIIDFFEVRNICRGKYPGFSHVKPKYHLLEHLPEQLLSFGAFTGFWTARCESKHRDFVNWAESSKNFINLLKTLSRKNQKKLASRSFRGFFSVPSIQFPSKLQLPSEGDGIIPAGVFHLGDLVTDKVIVNGTKYRVGQIVVKEVMTDNFLVVGVILKVVVRGTAVYFLIILHEAVRNIFGVFDTLPLNTVETVAYTALEDYKPLIARGGPKCFQFVLHHHLPGIV